MLLSADAVETALGQLTDRDFYLTAHGHVFAAIVRLAEIREDVDPITVAAELRSMGLLEEAGGPGALIDLEGKCVSTASAPSYAAIVERHSRQRRMMSYAYDLAAKAREGVDWHADVGRMLELGQTNGVVHSPSTLDLVDLGPILSGDLEEERPLWLRRNDGAGLLYPGRVHDLHSAPSIGKTWVALAAVRDVLGAGGNVLFLDYEDTAASNTARLLAIGTPIELISDPTRYRYARPSGAMGLAELAELARLLATLEPDLVVLDGVASALALNGFDENSNTDVNAWSVMAVRPLTEIGAAVLLLDHVVKSTEHRTRGARGAGAKLALITGASYELKLSRAFSRTKAGSGRLVVAKDRIGFVGGIGEIAAEITFRPHDEGRVFDVELHASDPDAPHRLTGLMESLSRRLEGSLGPLSSSNLFAGFGSKDVHLSKALADLVADGYVTEVKAGGQTTTYRTEKAYREPDDDDRPEPADRTRRTADRPGLDGPGRDDPNTTDPTNVVPLFGPYDPDRDGPI
jgi:hypothetical protein